MNVLYQVSRIKKIGVSRLNTEFDYLYYSKTKFKIITNYFRYSNYFICHWGNCLLGKVFYFQTKEKYYVNTLSVNRFKTKSYK